MYNSRYQMMMTIKHKLCYSRHQRAVHDTVIEMYMNCCQNRIINFNGVGNWDYELLGKT